MAFNKNTLHETILRRNKSSKHSGIICYYEKHMSHLLFLSPWWCVSACPWKSGPELYSSWLGYKKAGSARQSSASYSTEPITVQGVLAGVRVLFTGGGKLVLEKFVQLCRHLLGIRVGVLAIFLQALSCKLSRCCSDT